MVSVSKDCVQFQNRTVAISVFPIGIAPENFYRALDSVKVKERIAALERKFQDSIVIVGVDRLDYIKGIPLKLRAIEMFLDNHPELVGKVVFVQLAVPSRSDIAEYQKLRSAVNESIGRINGRFGTIEYTPIHFMHQSIPFDELMALYAVSDACIVTSIRDGMNLVSYEYIASQRDRQGTLILSDFTGAANYLDGSLFVNPWHTEELAGAIYEAIIMDREQRRSRHYKLSHYIEKHTSASWGKNFIDALNRVCSQPDTSQIPATNGHSKGIPADMKKLRNGHVESIKSSRSASTF